MVDESRHSTVFRYGDALAANRRRAGLRAQLEQGRAFRLRRGVYAATSNQVDRAAAAVLKVSGAVVSHETAAQWWGISQLSQPGEEVRVTRPRRGSGRAHYPGLEVHSAALPGAHVTSYCGMPVTTPARTVIDLARGAEFRAGVCAADSALRRNLCTREDLWSVVADCAGWPGVRRAREVVGFADRRAANPLESISRVAFQEYGLPTPQLQVEMPSFDVVDFLWEQFGVVGEADGLGKYVDSEVLRREKLRQERLEQDGFAVFRWTWREVFRRPDAVAYRGEQVLRRRGWSR
ncbi:DUF559 domain-containing protein [Natronosporangium hydrolyticum]|uniref:DUF559 domain-containing protein n=1 Tax=Natronosporangium hydrolyticum TaxID=2811111 RepID=A0A895YAE9_9ACTN|nr:type IV toxin-antitoxin system AbiEi family antitoxin [Natronosporangium hydrolyticum]QSB14351.1 DUF559 domain-containing protein [Natronosporangium hydrolyticum]